MDEISSNFPHLRSGSILATLLRRTLFAVESISKVLGKDRPDHHERDVPFQFSHRQSSSTVSLLGDPLAFPNPRFFRGQLSREVWKVEYAVTGFSILTRTFTILDM
jgi:hypothetical protein